MYRNLHNNCAAMMRMPMAMAMAMAMPGPGSCLFVCRRDR